MFNVNDFCTIFVYGNNTMGFYFGGESTKDYEILNHPIVKINPKDCKKDLSDIRNRYQNLQAFK